VIHGLVVTHGAVGEEMLKVVGMILGPEPGLASLSNAGLSLRDLATALSGAVRTAEEQDGSGTLVFIDDVAGSCATAARLAAAENGPMRVVSGVNLAMLLDFTTWRESLDLDELARRLVEKGRSAIGEVTLGDEEA
jgi:mannose/fructose-specific phosphotransferase system component IIA